MSGVLASFASGERVRQALPPRGEDRWSTRAGRRPATAMTLFLTVSAMLHGAMVIAAFLAGQPTAPRPQQDIAVEIVREVPKVPETPEAAAAPEAAAGKPPESKPVESQKAEASAPVSPKETAKAAERPPEQPAAPRPRTKPQSETSELDAMRDELAKLQAEHAALQAEDAAVAPEAPVPSTGPAAGNAAGNAAGLGPLASSFQAIALPTETETGEGEVVGYAAVVFSRLAKAKAIGAELGQPGTAGLSFEIDDKGILLGVRLLNPSGIAALDREALAIVRRAAPFPPPPPGAQRSFSANVSFVAGSKR